MWLILNINLVLKSSTMIFTYTFKNRAEIDFHRFYLTIDAGLLQFVSATNHEIFRKVILSNAHNVSFSDVII